jgi:tRNA pseudouridine38-40 synthase
VRWALGLEYDGSSFNGWQSQPHGNTVQDVLEHALGVIAGVPVKVVCAGRTDTGVHALVQVVHFDTASERPASAWIRGVNAHLPEAVAVRWAQPVADGFHARYAATARRYRYLLCNRAVRPGLDHRRVGWFHLPLDLDAMRHAAALLHGEHDFSAFRSAECQAKTPVRTLHDVGLQCRGDLVVFEFRANAFLHHMVRNLVGALVHVGKGARPPGWIAEVLRGRDRSRAAPTFSAAGLYLSGIEYDVRWQLPENGRIIARLFLPPG